MHGNGETRILHVAFGFGFQRFMLSFVCDIRLISGYKVFFSLRIFWVVSRQIFSSFLFSYPWTSAPMFWRSRSLARAPHSSRYVILVYPVLPFFMIFIFLWCGGDCGQSNLASLRSPAIALPIGGKCNVNSDRRAVVIELGKCETV